MGVPYVVLDRFLWLRARCGTSVFFCSHPGRKTGKQYRLLRLEEWLTHDQRMLFRNGTCLIRMSLSSLRNGDCGNRNYLALRIPSQTIRAKSPRIA